MIVGRALGLGRMALFAGCGLGKTFMQLEWARIVSEHTNKPVLVLAPFAVVQQTIRESAKFGISAIAVSDQSDVVDGAGILVSNYEKLHKFDASAFSGIVLDESSILKGLTSSTKAQIIEFSSDIHYRLACTATPSPNDLMEIGNHAEFIGVIRREEMLATYFTHDGGDTSKWRLKGHAKTEKFWQWVSSWAVMLEKPSDIGADADDSYKLPKLIKKPVVIETRIEMNADLLIQENAKGLREQRKLARESLEDRCIAAADIVNADPDRQWVVWCNLNDESKMIASFIPGAVEVTGSDKAEFKCQALKDFQDGKIKVLVTKPRIAGYGQNWQNCQRMLFIGLNNSFEDMYQALRRCWRFGQQEKVIAYFVQHKQEGNISANIKRKEKQFAEMYQHLVGCMKNPALWASAKRTSRNTDAYNPNVTMQIPSWLVDECATETDSKIAA